MVGKETACVGRVGVGSGNPKLSKNRTFEERPERDKEANFTAI